MKRLLTLSLTLALAAALLGGCNINSAQRHAPVVIEKIEPENAVYEVREVPAEPAPVATSYVPPQQGEATAILAAVYDVLAADYPGVHFATDLSSLFPDAEGDDLASIERTVRDDAIYMAHMGGLATIYPIDRQTIAATNAWVTRDADGNLTDNIITVYLSSFENIDGDTEYVVELRRAGNLMRTLRYIMPESDGTSLEQIGDTRSVYYSGGTGAVRTIDQPTKTGHEKTMYFGGNLYKTGIKEMPVLDGINMNLRLDAIVVEGDVKGGFAGMLQGSVTIDKNEISLTANTIGMTVPLALVDNPGDYYLAFSRVAIANPQDDTAYRNIYLVKTDFSEILGYYSVTLDAERLYSWFNLSRIDKQTFTNASDTNHQRLLALYTDTFITSHKGNLQPSIAQLIIPSNMLIGTYFDDTSAALKKDLAGITGKVYEYYYALVDTSPNAITRDGLDGGKYFPDGRTAVCRLFAYDGDTAIVAVDYASKGEDAGFGGLYRAVYADGAWTLENLVANRIS